MSSTRTKALALIALIIIIFSLVIKNWREYQTTISKPIPLSANESLEIDPNILIEDEVVITSAMPKSVVQTKPLISAEAYLVGNLETGEIYTQHNQSKVFPIASISKLFSALVAINLMPQDQKITINQQMLDAYGDAGQLILGEIFTVAELLQPLLVESSNDAAEALAQSSGYDIFIGKMNSFAKELGLQSTSFKDSSGLNPGNISNANDLFILSRYLYLNERRILEISRQVRVEIASSTGHSTKALVSNNPFPGDPNFIGGKTGRTDEARESMVSMFNYRVGDKVHPIVIIVLRSDFSVREVDTSILFEQAMTKIGR
ncbi:MAG: serine hydrolase [Patescibacteria group bacterium]